MTTLSGSSLPFVKGFDDYLSKASAHDQDRPGGPSARVEHVSTLGDCRPESFVGDMLRTRLAYGKGELEIDAYSYVLSHSHEELDPGDDQLGAVAHGLAREWAREAWPGRQVKIVTQRDNGRWEGDGDERVWVDGHWHSHVVVANVAEQDVTLRWRNADGDELVKSYPAGRAIDGDLKNIFRLRHVTDDVVMREWRYDNAAYVEACQRFADGAASKQDLAQRAERGYSTYDQVRLKLRTAAAQSTDWDDFVARCQAAAVDVRVRGKSGVSYSWVGDDGLERKARARGKDGIGPEFTRAEIEARCAENVAALERGETLEAPAQELVVPTTTVAPDRPRPVYLTDDGRPPWADDQALEAYAQRVRERGGTYEGRAARALVTGEGVDGREGVELTRDGDGVTATVGVGAGPLVVDVEPELVARVAEADAITASAKAEARTIRSTATKDATATTLRARRQAEEIVNGAEADAGQIRAKARAAGLAAGAGTWEREHGDAYRAGVRAEVTGRVETEMAGRVQSASDLLEDAQEVLDDLSQYDDRDAVYRRAGQRKIDMPTRDGGTRKVTINAVLDKDVEHLLAKNAEKVRQAKDLRDKLDKGTKHLRESDERKAAQDHGQGQDWGHDVGR